MFTRNRRFQINSLFAISAMLMVAAGCNSTVTHIDGVGEPKNETRELESFNTIKVEGIGQITINYGKPLRCAVTTEENLLEHYSTTVKNDVLTLTPIGPIRPAQKLRVAVDCDLLTRIEVDGAAEVKLNGFYGSELTVIANGSSWVAADGQVDHLELTSDGACEIEMFKLKAKTVNAELQGASKANLFANETITVDVHGAASICYDGKAKLDKTQDGVGTIRRRR